MAIFSISYSESGKKLLSLKRLEEANKINNNDINEIKIILNFEKYNTLF